MTERDFSTRARRPRGASVGERTLALVAVLALLFAASEASRARRDLAAARAVAEAERRELRDAEQQLDRFRSRHGPSGDRIAGQVVQSRLGSPLRVIAELAAMMPDDVRQQSLNLDYGEALAVSAELRARDAHAYDRLVERLVKSEAFHDVAPGLERRDGELRASLGMQYVVGARR